MQKHSCKHTKLLSESKWDFIPDKFKNLFLILFPSGNGYHYYLMSGDYFSVNILICAETLKANLLHIKLVNYVVNVN